MTDAPRADLLVEPLADTWLLRFPHLMDIPGFVHAVTTKPWNLATHCGPQTDRAVDRRRMLCEHLGLPFERLTIAEQVHSGHVIRLAACDVGAGRLGRQTALRFVDGMICDLPEVPVMQFSADCPIVLVVEPQRRVFGTAHASWRGTVAEIAGELVRQLVREFGVRPAELRVGIAPCAGPADYEVGEEVYRIASARLEGADRFFSRRTGKLLFDLRAANVAQLGARGVSPANVRVAAASTIGDDRFYSHRREGQAAGRFALIAGFRSR